MGFGDMMKQAKDMQERVQRIQQEIAETEVTGESGAGMVSVTMTGRHDVKRVQIDPALRDEDMAVLEDLIAAAVNDAVLKVERTQQDKMGELTAGLPLPPGMKLF